MRIINNFRNYILDEELEINVYKNKVNIVNYTSIVNFTSKEIIVNYDEGQIIVTGNNLSISRLLIDEVLILGVIEKIELR